MSDLKEVAAVAGRPNPPLRRLRLGIELRRLREESGLTIREVAERLYYSMSKVSRVETARVSATVRDVEKMLKLYCVSVQQSETLTTLAREALEEEAQWHAYGESPDVWTFITYEMAAQRICVHEALLIPGLLQVEEYARRVIPIAMPWLRPAEVERHVKLRMQRQSVLTGNDPPTLLVVLDEAVLKRMISDRPVMRKQLDRLIKLADMPNVTLQVLPFAAGYHVSMSGAFTILRFRDSANSDLVYLEQTSGDVYLKSPDQLRRYKLLFRHLQAVALPPRTSITFLRELLERHL